MRSICQAMKRIRFSGSLACILFWKGGQMEKASLPLSELVEVTRRKNFDSYFSTDTVEMSLLVLMVALLIPAAISSASKPPALWVGGIRPIADALDRVADGDRDCLAGEKAGGVAALL